MANTIYALSTAYAKSAIAIVRVSGVNAKASLNILTNISNPTPTQLKLCKLKNINGITIDNPLVVFFPKNRSYTGEDLVEYHIHGSLAIIKELLDSLSKIEGYRLAEKGEFTKRALENNKLNLIQAEGILDLIESETFEQHKQAIRELEGEISNKYTEWLNDLKTSLSLIETTIDFSEEEIPDNLFANVDSNIINLQKIITTELNNYSGIKKLKKGINLTILGAPNVGKSSLINYLTKEDTAIVSSEAGTTRDVVSAHLDIFGYPVVINDTAGIRDTENKIEIEGINKAKSKASVSDIKIIIIDITDYSYTYNQIKNYLNGNYILLVNKVDKIDNINEYDLPKNAILISIKNNYNLDKFTEILKNNLKNISKVDNNPVILQERHKEILVNINNNLQEYLKVNDIVLKSHYLRLAINDIARILGKVDIEEVLDIIFSKFCIGK